MKENIIVCENIRSAYNVGNIIRNADGLCWDVILSWYSAPLDHPKVQKTALGAQESVWSKHFHHPDDALQYLREQWYTLIAAEKTDDSLWLDTFETLNGPLAVIVGNEIVGVREETLQQVDYVVHIPMMGTKESLNVGQAAAIVMWEMV